MTNQARNPKPETGFIWSFGHSDLIGHSDFGFRISAAARRAFTLVEMITVLTIIILVLAIAIPVWNALMGGTNLATAQNQIAAFLSNARSDAIYNRQTIGVFFFIDPKTQRTAMAEVQVQTLWQTNVGYTSLFQPGSWTNAVTWTPPTNNNGPIYSLELVNYIDPNSTVNTNTPPTFIFYRDVALLPAGVGVALNNNTYSYMQTNGIYGWNSSYSGSIPPLDRYMRVGAIMFAPDGTLTQIPYGVPYWEDLTYWQYQQKEPQENALCQQIGMFGMYGTAYDFASNITYTENSAAPTNVTPQYLPLRTSVGFVIFDHDAYKSQHATLTVRDQSQPAPATAAIGDGSPFSDEDLNYYLSPNSTIQPGGAPTAYQAQDKFIEENWIDQNGISLMVNPLSGTLIKAK